MLARRRLPSAALGYGRSPITSGNYLGDAKNMVTGWVQDGTTLAAGGADPLGGTSGIVMTDTAANVLHRFYQQPLQALVLGQQYLVSVYFKPGTFTSGVSFGLFDTGFSTVIVSNTGVASALAGQAVGVSGIQSAAAGNGFFYVSWVYTVQASVAGGGGFWVINFGQSGQAAYLGTVQNQTFWNPSMVLANT